MSAAFQPLSLDALANLEVPDTEYVIDGILPAGSLTLLSAREKAGKGLFTVDAVASVAFEQTFLDRATRGGTAIYVAAEESISLVKERILARVGDRRDGPLLVLPLNGWTEARLRLDDPAAMQMFANMIYEHEPSIAVLDTLRELHDRAENDSDEMGPLIRPLRQIAHKTGTAIVLNHHQNKQNGYRGSTAILAACDQEWALQRTDGDDTTIPTGMLTVKGRFGPKIVIHVKFGERGRWELTTPPVFTGEPGLRGRILAFLKASSGGHTAERIAQGLPDPKPSLKTIQNAISGMVQESPPPFVVHGSGRKNDPRRYQHRTPELWAPGTFEPINGSLPTHHLGIGNNGNHSAPVVSLIPGTNGNQSPLRRTGEA